MVIPTRQAPPVPSQNRGFTISNINQSTSRYTPTTDWDDKPFDAWTPVSSQNTQFNHQKSVVAQQQQQQPKVKKQAPPRPPPPREGFKPGVPLKKPSTVHSNTILANLLSRARLTKPNNKQTNKTSTQLPPLSSSSSSHNVLQQNINNYGSMSLKQSASFSSTASSITSVSNDMKLISFDSPPSSPTFTQKSNSDCVSVNSFSSDSNYSPNNGFSSESGFEDDFVLEGNNKPSTYKPAASIDPFDMLDAFGPTSNNTNNYRPPIAQKPVNVGNTSFYAFTGNVSSINPNNSKKPAETFDPLCNGKDLIKPVVAPKMPTIIRPNSAGKGKISPVHTQKPKAITPEPKPVKVVQEETFDDSFDDSLPSLPMPTMPPPPPPPQVSTTDFDDTETESYGLALYDFEGEHDDDLSLRANEKIYLLRRLNNEWFFGRNRRGCEGMFPANYIDIKIPLSDDSAVCSGSNTPSVEMGSKSVKCRVLYDFVAEQPEDLSLRVSNSKQ